MERLQKKGELSGVRANAEGKLAALLSAHQEMANNNMILSAFSGGAGGAASPAEALVDFDFVSNYAVIQNGVKNSFGYIRNRNGSGDSGNSGSQGSGSLLSGGSGGGQRSLLMSNGQGGLLAQSRQPPISRPVPQQNNNSLGKI